MRSCHAGGRPYPPGAWPDSVHRPAETRGVREVFAETDTRLPPLERAQLGTSGSVFASANVREYCELQFAEAVAGGAEPAWFRTDEARIRILGRTAGILGDLEAAIRRELRAEIRRETDAR